ncbi:hypothetical protein K6W16_12790 [Burkholderia dolosa]|uniref:Uncharacterized protein n=1 Tax=Burkholderia dolosa TaxID=152500 RepID=A0A892IJS6_9BURK|nr:MULTISPECIES: hypothetical protein [Burkholderia]ETP61230.1 hypothetical protein BDSB_26180 [Burkholderia dolosa PC543]MBR8419340.1 hypothetical protein [Burkholderia dolosa]MBY4657365.1 hypothetical protein [Burkholderia dolosa]MBY4688126.1 hypothetical protein [Burkholderia dolosa]MBY4781288.1 hypothetical protein [Burkholderia dolosa]
MKQITHSAREQLKKHAERALCTSALERIGARPMRYARMPRCGDSGVTRRDTPRLRTDGCRDCDATFAEHDRTIE